MSRAIQKHTALLLSLLILCGCAAMRQGFGTIVPDQIAERNFETFQLDPGMNYYFSGSDVYPSVIMGLKKQYVLDYDLWRPLEPDSKLFTKLIKDMQARARESGQLQRGFVMKSPEGQTVGVSYSTFTVKMRLKMGENNKVVVYTPDPNSYPYGDGGKGRRMW